MRIEAINSAYDSINPAYHVFASLQANEATSTERSQNTRSVTSIKPRKIERVVLELGENIDMLTYYVGRFLNVRV